MIGNYFNSNLTGFGGSGDVIQALKKFILTQTIFALSKFALESADKGGKPFGCPMKCVTPSKSSRRYGSL